MKSQDLMVGDWVNPLRKSIGKPCRAITIDAGTNTCWIDNNEYSGLVSCSELEPVLITPEILEKNGFSKLEHGWILKRIGMEICIEFIAEKWSLVIHNELALKDEHGRADLVTFCHDWFRYFCVHQLQHALIMCKIDKEIIV